MTHRIFHPYQRIHTLITVDIETDWGGRLSPCKENCQGVLRIIPELLSIFEIIGIKATFFVSGNIAKEHKSLLLEIIAQNHEIASHGYDHDIDYGLLDYNQLVYQIVKSKDVLEEICNQEILGLRIPQFRFNPHVYKVLAQTGLKYDSSIVEGKKFGKRYNYSLFPGGSFLSEGILEIPISTIPVINFPLGLLWINATGLRCYEILSKIKSDIDLRVFYFHPFDLLVLKRHMDFNFHITQWYSFKSKKAAETLKKLLHLWKMQESIFLTLKEYYLLKMNPKKESELDENSPY